jgi:dienelactone hydrolase
LQRVAPDDLSRLLAPHYVASLPEGDGPFPTALLASGCDGPRDNLQTWTAALNRIGWATLVVDSHTPRGLDGDPAWRLVCSGAVLPGSARAGDLAVALADARAMAFVDATRLALMGASHGGWAVLDLLALAGRRRPPENLSAWPTAPEGDVLDGVGAILALYPYCGEASVVSRRGWDAPIPVMMILVDDDTIVDETKCREIAEQKNRSGLPVTVLQFSGVTHGFDQREKSLFSTLAHNPAAEQKFLDALIVFLSDP